MESNARIREKGKKTGKGELNYADAHGELAKEDTPQKI